MHLPLTFISCGNILILLCCSLRDRKRESSRKHLVFFLLYRKALEMKRSVKINSQCHTQKLQPFKTFLKEERVFLVCVRRRAQCILTGLPGLSSETRFRQNWKWNRLWEGRKVARDTGRVTGNTSINTLNTQVRLVTIGGCTQFPSGILGNSINLFLLHSHH